VAVAATVTSPRVKAGGDVKKWLDGDDPITVVRLGW
jgi:hypothetical protein